MKQFWSSKFIEKFEKLQQGQKFYTLPILYVSRSFSHPLSRSLPLSLCRSVPKAAGNVNDVCQGCAYLVCSPAKLGWCCGYVSPRLQAFRARWHSRKATANDFGDLPQPDSSSDVPLDVDEVK